MGALEFRHIGKIYQGGVRAVSDFNLSVQDGEFIVIVGPSGCGKSTVLRMTAGLEEISEGDLLLDGVRINDKAPVDRDISVVFQDYALYPQLTVYDNVGMSLKVRHMDKGTIYDRVIETSRFLGIQDYLTRLPGQLSGGQKQRVSLGRAISRKTKVFLMDEPLSNLDAKLRNHTRSEIVRLQQQLGITTLYVTHDQVEAMTMAHRIVVINRGVIQQVGAPQEIYNHPANLFVAGFIGTPPMNFIPGTVRGGRLVNPKLGVDLAVPQGVAGREGASVTLGVRPEHLHISSRQEGKDGLPLEVVDTQFLGSRFYVLFRLGDLVVTGSLPDSIPTHQTVWVSFDRENAHYFDTQTTMRIEEGL